MQIFKIAKLLMLKHAASNADALESSLRANIHSLWRFPNELFNILNACSQANPKNAATPTEKKAVDGFKFCQQLLSMIDYLKVNQDTVPLGEIREVLLHIINLIQENIHKHNEDGKIIQFPHVSELIFQMIPSRTVHERKKRDEQFGKAKTGLSRIQSLAATMLKEIEKLEIMVPENFTYKEVTQVDRDQPIPDRFSPQRAPLSVYDIVDFIRQHGLDYFLPDKEAWQAAITDDPILKEQITTVINAVNRGHDSKDSAEVKIQIQKILKDYVERRINNAPEFEQP